MYHQQQMSCDIIDISKALVNLCHIHMYYITLEAG